MRVRTLCFRGSLLTCLCVLLWPAFGAGRPAPDPSHPLAGGRQILGAPLGAAKAAGDSTLLMGPSGSGAPYVGNFETGPWGDAAWNGWTSVDLSAVPAAWHVDDYQVVNGIYSAWCGEARFASCGLNDPDGGYGNNYDDALEWRGAVADPGLPCTVTVAAVVNHDVEPGYDFCSLEVETAGGAFVLWTADGAASGVTIGGSHVYQPADYVAGDEVVVVFRVTSDGAFSDEDCFYPTAGAMQLDDVVIALTNGAGTSHGFEDGTLGPFTVRSPLGVGDFAQIWWYLEDIDPCITNYTPQVAFIDDGIVVPGTGGSPCINWCYGPGGWIVNTTGGLAGEDAHLANAVVSPVMAWPDPAMRGARLDYTSMEHEDLGPDAPGIIAMWHVRSTASADPADIEAAPWRERNYFLFDWGGTYRRNGVDLTTLLEPGCTFVQVRLGAYELGWVWGYTGDDGYPAPYFDNVRLTAYELGGPALSAQDRYLAQDAFPESGAIDLQDRAANNVRFDMAADISTAGTSRNDPGDSLIFEAAPSRDGAVMTGPPRLFYRLLANPAFAAVRTSGLPTVGSVACSQVYAPGGAPIADRWSADLPDSGFLFPGDVLHYYLRAEDVLAADMRASVLPADTTGFSDFDDPWAYDQLFTVRALPTLVEGTGALLPGTRTLLWFDGSNSETEARWQTALAGNRLDPGRNCDLFVTNAASSALGNGLGGRATAAQLDQYWDLVYTSADKGWNTLAYGNPDTDPSLDVQVLDAWLRLGYRDAFMTGDGLASDLSQEAPVTQAFLQTWLGVDVVTWNLRPLIDNQTAPQVVPTNEIPFFGTEAWIAYGGCLVINSFDGIEPRAGTVRLAEFTNPAGIPGAYGYAAATMASNMLTGSRVVSLPYDLGYVYANPGTIYWPPGSNAAQSVLLDVGVYLGFITFSDAVPDEIARARFATRHYPNPFNPAVKIDCSIARPGRLSVRVYDVRGRLVRTVCDENVEQGVTLTWDGRDDRGAQAASGIYFYEARMHGEVKVGRMTLVK